MTETKLGEPLTNDGIHTEDKLGYKMYAKVLCYQLNHVTSPLTFGIFAKWGSGKSFLLRLTKELLTTCAEDKNTDKKAIVCAFFALVSIIALGILIAAFLVSSDWLPIVALSFGIPVAFLMLLLCTMGVTGSKFPHFKLLFCAALSKMPQRAPDPNPLASNRDAANQYSKGMFLYGTPRKFIYVDFNAWKHGGSDDIWAAIVTSIVDRVEEEIGTFTVRLFRSINFKESQEKTKFTCCLRHLCRYHTRIWLIPFPCLALIAVILTVLVSVFVIKFALENSFKQFIWIPPTAAAVLSVTWAVLRSIYAIVNSQTSRINRALNRTRRNMSEKLGFMKLVKDEVMAVSNLIRSLEYVYEENYRIVLAIDDLDRVTHDKVRVVLDAVNILLSDHSSPFFCLIAVDPVVAINSIDGRSDATINVTKHGHEYLKKIINVPFCLPEVTPKIELYLVSMLKDQDAPVRRKTNLSTFELAIIFLQPVQDKWGFFDQAYASKVTRKFLQTELCKEHIYPNPRNIKRIINVVSMAITFVAFHNPKEVIMDSLSICHGKNDVYRESQIHQANQGFINTFKILITTSSITKFFGILHNKVESSKEEGSYGNELWQATLEACTSMSTFAEKENSNLVQAVSDATEANNAAALAKRFVSAARKAESRAQKANKNAKEARKAVPPTSSTAIPSTLNDSTISNDSNLDVQPSPNFDRVFVDAQSADDLEIKYREAAKIAKEDADAAKANATTAKNALTVVEECTAQAVAAAKLTVDAANSAVSQPPPSDFTEACLKAEKFAKKAKDAREKAEKAHKAAATRASDANAVVTGTRLVATKFTAENEAKVGEVKNALIKDFCENLTLLILMIEQWPFLTSLLLQGLDDNFMDPLRDGRKVFGHKSLYQVYKDLKLNDLKPTVALDCDPLAFEHLLIKMDKINHRLNTTTTHNLRKYAINFDPRQMQTYLAAKENVAQSAVGKD